ncbi:TRAP transporter small permease [Paracoccus suum]|uniref:TRAP transporter small permease protein n=1 Tax=Paracoccus suum TaxID=2259340 RepID=A0A344PMW2_9RHOB|nr:TRAP transporter small permease [Paracoccus suum]
MLLALIAMTCATIAGRIELWLSGQWPQLGWLAGLRPIRGDYELVEMGTAIAVACFLPWCQIARGHARVDLFGRRLPAWLDMLWDLLMAAAMALLAWRVGAGMMQKLASGESSFLRGIPLWWGYAGVLPGLGLASLAALACAIGRATGDRRG